MVVGNGMIAKRFKEYIDDDRFLIFASGVSNSKTTDLELYNRELQLLQQTIQNNDGKTIVYFSTCSIYDPSENGSQYVLHKKALEQEIVNTAKQYYIFRTSNIVGKSPNPNTVFSFFINSIRNDVKFKVWEHATRNLIDIDDFYHIADEVLKSGIYRNSIVNIANPDSYPVTYIVQSIDRFLDKKGNYDTIDKGADFVIDISNIKGIISKLNIAFDDNYLERLLRKYN